MNSGERVVIAKEERKGLGGRVRENSCSRRCIEAKGHDESRSVGRVKAEGGRGGGAAARGGAGTGEGGDERDVRVVRTSMAEAQTGTVRAGGAAEEITRVSGAAVAATGIPHSDIASDAMHVVPPVGGHNNGKAIIPSEPGNDERERDVVTRRRRGNSRKLFNVV